jgi:phosphotriesterase-related protein
MDMERNLWKEKVQGNVMTVNGLIPADDMGITLPHEHLLIYHWPQDVNLTDIETAVSELGKFKGAGGKTLVEMTNVGIKRDPVGLKKISSRTGVNIIMGSGYYKNSWVSSEVNGKTVEEISQEIIEDIVYGVGRTGIHAGVIGEIGVSRQITKTEERVLIAAAIAQKETGAAVNVHFDIDALEEERNYSLDILADSGADTRRVIFSHFIPRLENMAYLERMAEKGIYIEFDLFGGEADPGLMDMIKADVKEQVTVIKNLVKEGLADKILISQDICFKKQLTVYGGFGYAHILNNIVPLFRESNIAEEEIKTMIIENPKRVFPFQF